MVKPRGSGSFFGLALLALSLRFIWLGLLACKIHLLGSGPGPTFGSRRAVLGLGLLTSRLAGYRGEGGPEFGLAGSPVGCRQ